MSIFLKLNLESGNRRLSALSQSQDGRDSIISLIFSEKKRRGKRTHTEPNTPKSDNIPTTDLLDINKEPEKDKFLDIFEKPEKDHADGRAIYRKLAKNTFFEENKELFEEKLDAEAIIYLCKGLTLETYQQNEIVYERGDKMNGKIYFVYKGELESFHGGETNTFKQSNFSTMSREATEGGAQPKPRLSFLFKQLNIESGITQDPVTGKKYLNMKGLLALNPHLKFAGKKISRGEYFGGEVLNSEHLDREESIMAKTETHLLVLNVKDFEHIKRRYEKETIQKLNFILKHLSVSLQNEAEIKNKFFSCMVEKVLPLGETLLTEGDSDHCFYFLYEGKCEVQRRMKDGDGSPKTKSVVHKNVSVCLMESGTFLGEEVLFKNHACYEYTIKVISAKAVFLKFDVKHFKHTIDTEIIASIQESYEEKAAKHQEIFESVSKELNKRNNTKTHSSLNIKSKSPTHSSHMSANLGFGARWDLINASSHTPNAHEKELEPLTVTQRTEGPASKRFLTHMGSPAVEKSLQVEKRHSLTNKGITMIKDQILPFHHQVIVAKHSGDDGSQTVKAKRGKGHNTVVGTKETEFDDSGYRNNRGYDSLDEVVRTNGNEGKNVFHSNRMDDYLNSLEDFEDFQRDSPKRAKDTKFINNIENFRLNFKGMDEEKKGRVSHSNVRNTRGSFLDSPLFTKEGHEADIVILNPGKIRSNDYQSKSPVAKGSKSIKFNSASKINLESLKNQFFESPNGSMREYLANYKKAHLQNKLSRNIANPLHLKEADYAVKKPRMLPHLKKDDYSPKMYTLSDSENLRISLTTKSPKVMMRKNEHILLEPINQKAKQMKVSLGRMTVTDRELREK